MSAAKSGSATESRSRFGKGFRPRAGLRGLRRAPSIAAAPELASPPDTVLPNGFALRVDPAVRRSRNGRLLLGGSPPRLLRLSELGARLVASGRVTVRGTGTNALARTLLDAGIGQPTLDCPAEFEVSVVIPVRDRPVMLARLLTALRADPDTAPAEILVVDDESLDPKSIVDVCAQHNATVIRHQRNRGPARARNTGLRAAHAELVACCDSDVVPEPGWLRPLVAQFADPALALAAPRISALAGPPGWIADFDEAESPLDMGPHPAPIVPLSTVAYVPSAALVLRRSAVGPGFAPELRVAEDVDLCLRLHEAGWRLRYVPDAVVRHEHRSTARAWLAQRAFYGTGAARLAQRHPGLVPPLHAAPWSLAVVALLLTGRLRGLAAGAAITAVVAARLARRLPDADTPVRAGLLLTVGGLWGSARQLGHCALRHHWPVALLAAAMSGRARRLLLGVALADAALGYRKARPRSGFIRYLLVRRAADLSYGAGLWWGALRARTLAPLLPRLAGRPAAPPAAQRASATAASAPERRIPPTRAERPTRAGS